ncbi:MAG TPA: DUF4037 domain-containing protein [Candidatus Limnocylindria bacterium]|nr:DUF4037 domain-containing protein [Candidatus Limnocylindria bacterium]
MARSIGASAVPELFPATLERVQRWRLDPDVVGVLLVGSKSRGYGDGLSDDDLEVLLRPEAFHRLAPEACIEVAESDTPGRLAYDAQYLPDGDLERKAGSTFDHDHWPYQRAVVLHDPEGRVRPAVAAAGAMDESFRRTRLQHAMIDGWVASRRAEKTVKRRAEGAVRLLLSRAARALIRIAFGLESRWVPLEHWLERELATLPDPEGTGSAALQVLAKPDPRIAIAALERLEPRLLAAGLPGGPAGRRQLFFEIVHPARAAERAIHAVL